MLSSSSRWRYVLLLSLKKIYILRSSKQFHEEREEGKDLFEKEDRLCSTAYAMTAYPKVSQTPTNVKHEIYNYWTTMF